VISGVRASNTISEERAASLAARVSSTSPWGAAYYARACKISPILKFLSSVCLITSQGG